MLIVVVGGGGRAGLASAALLAELDGATGEGER
jgi:hypothetical protein